MAVCTDREVNSTWKEQMEGIHSLPWNEVEVKKAMVTDLSFKDSVGICWKREAEADRTDKVYLVLGIRNYQWFGRYLEILMADSWRT